jgi:hypothetical protein
MIFVSLLASMVLLILMKEDMTGEIVMTEAGIMTGIGIVMIVMIVTIAATTGTEGTN